MEFQRQELKGGDREMPSGVTLTINGLPVSVPSGSTVLKAARAAGVFVPSLSASDRLRPYYSCRMNVAVIASITAEEIDVIRKRVIALYREDGWVSPEWVALCRRPFETQTTPIMVSSANRSLRSPRSSDSSQGSNLLGFDRRQWVSVSIMGRPNRAGLGLGVEGL